MMHARQQPEAQIVWVFEASGACVSKCARFTHMLLRARRRSLEYAPCVPEGQRCSARGGTAELWSIPGLRGCTQERNLPHRLLLCT